MVGLSPHLLPMYLLSVLPLSEDHWKVLECLLFSLLYVCVEAWVVVVGGQA